jgi:hypothetical protein
MVAYLIIISQFLFTVKIQPKVIFKFTFFVLLSLTGMYFTLNYLGYNLNNWFEDRLLAEGSLRETTRYSAWVNFQRFFPENPIFGIGVHMTREIEVASNEAGSSQIHVGFLAHLISYGVVGSLFLFGFWFFLSRKMYLNAKKTKYYGSFFALLVFLWGNMTLVKYSMFYYGIIFAFIFDKYYQNMYNVNYLKQKYVSDKNNL